MIHFILLVFLPALISAVQMNPLPRAVNTSLEQTFTLKKVSSSGSKRFTEADVVRATGLKPGSTVSADDLKQAAARLGESGVFAQVSYRFNGETADYTVVDAAQFVPVTFENFIWFSDNDLIQRVHISVPLFNGAVPFAGNLVDQVSASLDVILKEKGIHGHATSMMHGKLAGQIQSMQYHIDGVDVKIAEIKFAGAAPDHGLLLKEAIKKVAGENYLQSSFAEVIQLNTPQVYGKLGFLKAQFGTPKPVLVKDDPVQPIVVVEIPVQEGDQYTFSAASWTGANAIPVAELEKTIDLKPGAPADTTQLARDIARAKEIYGTKGYMNAQVKSTANLDNEKHTAVFNLAVNEGPLYYMGKLEIQVPDAERAELVRRTWGMHEGDIYDASYVKTFMIKHPRELASLAGWAPRYTQTIHDDTHFVDLLLKFEKFQREAK